MTFIAEEVRELMAEMGFRTLDQMIGRSDRLEMRAAIDHWKAKGLDFACIFHQPDVGTEVARYNCQRQDHDIEDVLDRWLIEQARPALEARRPVRIETRVRNTNRIVGGMLSGEVAKNYGHHGLADDTIWIKCVGTAGQSFGVFLRAESLWSWRGMPMTM